MQELISANDFGDKVTERLKKKIKKARAKFFFCQNTRFQPGPPGAARFARAKKEVCRGCKKRSLQEVRKKITFGSSSLVFRIGCWIHPLLRTLNHTPDRGEDGEPAGTTDVHPFSHCTGNLNNHAAYKPLVLKKKLLKKKNPTGKKMSTA